MLDPDEIELLIERYAAAARQARACGFSGVQIHAAHGYLISQFLSPRSNRRTDEWGGSLDNRARFLRAIVAAVRAQTGSDFAVSVKLNSSDFQQGGFGADDARQVGRGGVAPGEGGTRFVPGSHLEIDLCHSSVVQKERGYPLVAVGSAVVADRGHDVEIMSWMN